MNLLGLPDELLTQIASELAARDLIGLQQICSRLHHIVRANAYLQYVIDLHVAGMVDNPASRIVPAERLRMLREQDKAWRGLDLSERRTLLLQHHPSGIYDLTGGVLLLGERAHPEGQTGTDKVRTVLLHSAFHEDSTLPPSWSTIDLGKQVIDVGLAIQEHDLIAIVTYTYVEEAHLWASIDIHLIQHSTGQPHPAAQKPVLHYHNIHYLPGCCGIMLEVAGDTLCFMLNNNFPFVAEDPVSLVIYNWKTGHPKVGQKRLHSDPTMFNSFILLSPDTVVLPIVPTNTLEICHFAKELASPPPPQLAEGPQTAPDVPLLETTCVLELPALQPGAIVLRLTCRCEPNPRGPPSCVTHVDARRPFHSDPDVTVMILHMHIRLPHGATRVYTMITHRSSLLKLLRSALETQRNRAPPQFTTAPRSSTMQELLELDIIEEVEELAHPQPDGPHIIPHMIPLPGDALDEEEISVIIPWAEWGPAVTRWFYDELAGTRWITTTCGQRFLRVRSDGRLYVYDFNKLAMMRYMHERELMGAPLGSLPGESVIGAEKQEHPQMDARVEEMEFDDEDDEEDDTHSHPSGQVEPDSSDAEVVVNPQRRVRVVLGKTVIDDASAWEDQMESWLPFIETSARISEEFLSALVDEDIIVGLKMDTRGTHIREIVLYRIGGPGY